MMKTSPPIISSDKFTIHKDASLQKKVLVTFQSDVRAPWDGFYVKSEKTGRTIMFRPVPEGHPLFDPDGWDGELIYMIPNVEIPDLSHLVIYNT